MSNFEQAILNFQVPCSIFAILLNPVKKRRFLDGITGLSCKSCQKNIMNRRELLFSIAASAVAPDFNRRERRARRAEIKIKNLSVLCALGGKNPCLLASQDPGAIDHIVMVVPEKYLHGFLSGDGQAVNVRPVPNALLANTVPQVLPQRPRSTQSF
jgi:hypothetical protein